MIPLHLPPGDTSTERTLQIDGTSEQIETAKQLVNEVINEVCLFVLSCELGALAASIIVCLNSWNFLMM